MNKTNNDRLDKFIAHPYKAVWIVAAPMMAGFTVHALYVVVDAIFIGQMGSDSLAAATYIGAFFFAAIALTNGLATGITATVAQAFGRRDTLTVNHIASNGLTLGIITGVVFGLAGLLLGPMLIPILGAKGLVAEQAWNYMMPLWAGMPLFFISTSLRSVLNGEGNAKTPTIILTFSTLMNIALDPLLMFTFDLGIKGAAYATIISQLFALLAFYYVAFVKKQMIASINFSLMFPNSKLVLNIIKIAVPAAIGHLVMAFGMGFVNKIISTFGQTAVAGIGAGTKIDMIVILPILGLAAATVTIIGMFAGAKRPQLIRQTALYAYKWALILALVLGVSAYLTSDILIGLFVKDPYAKQVGVNYISFMIVAYPLMAFGMVTGRILQGLGYGMPSLMITFIRVIVIGVAGSYVAVYLFNAPIEAIWCSFILGGLIADVLSFFWIRKYLWKQDPCTMSQ